MWLQTSCRLEFEITAPTPFVYMLRPRSGAQQWVASQEYKVAPQVPVVEFTDGYGNLCQRLVAPKGAFSISTSSKVLIADQVDRAPGAPFTEIQYLPDPVLSYLFPSRYCEADSMGQIACEITAGQKPGYDQVEAIANWVHKNVEYRPGQSAGTVTAQVIYDQKWGVCRDMSHLGITLCRSLSIPARLVVGYLHQLEPMDLHAWFEAYVNGRWYTFDPTEDTLHGGYVAIGYGRDAADVAIFNQFGPNVTSSSQTVVVERIEDNAA